MSDFNPAEIEAIGFDLDNTLLDRNQAVHGWLGSVLGDQPDVLAEAIGYDNSGFISRPHFYNWLSERLDWAANGAEVERRFQGEVFDFFEPNPDVVQFIRDLAATEIPLTLLTNGDASFQLSKFKLLGVDDCFKEHRRIATGAIGFHKPDRRAFDAMINSVPAA
ncbi:MAG: HAD family hydrolase, partial [Verrucomicrobiota bacterium]